MASSDAQKKPPLTSAYDELVHTIEMLSNHKISDFNLGAVKETFQQMREREAREVAREIACANKKSADDYVSRLYNEGIVDKRWKFNSLVQDSNNTQALMLALKFCTDTAADIQSGQRMSPKLFLLFGGAGTGKTVIANAMANEYLAKGVFSLELTSFDMIVNSCYFQSDEKREERIERYEEWEHYLKVKVLIIDGLGQVTDGFNLFEQKIFSNLVRTRCADGLPLIITTAISPEAFSQAIGSFSYESVKEYSSLCVQLFGTSRRKPLMLSGFNGGAAGMVR